MCWWTWCYRCIHSLVYSVDINRQTLHWDADSVEVSEWFWCVHGESVLPSKYLASNWASAQVFSTTSNYDSCCLSCRQAAAEPRRTWALNPALSCLPSATAPTPRRSKCALEICLVTWNIHVLVSWMVLSVFISHISYLRLLQTRAGRVLLADSKGRGWGGDGRIRSADHHNQGLFHH